MIIFGWGHRTAKNYGPTYKIKCEHCNNEDVWYLAKYTTWFTLFFIPVIPYDKKYFMGCPVCQSGVLLSEDQADELAPLADLNKRIVEGKITESEYKAQLANLAHEKKVNAVSPGKDVTVKSSSGSNDCCRGCGAKLATGAKYCGSCGKQV